MTFTKRLLDWYDKNKRDLPFRQQKDPYNIWVSEIMAQQTQIKTMIPYYLNWIKVYPNIETLAKADIDEVLKMWEGLGYYSRARNLHKGANFVMEHFNGALPASKKELMRIPGIGEYTSSAIASIAFDLPEIAVDGNVKRVMARTLNYTENVNTKKAHQFFEDWLKHELAINKAHPSDFTQALMELGALVCTPSNTTCIGCPLEDLCACWRGEVVGQVPFIPKKKPSPVYDKSVFIMIEDGSIYLSNDDSDGLMKGLMRLPQIEGHQSDLEPLMEIKHKFTHLTWNIKVYQKEAHPMDTLLKVKIENLDDYSIVTGHKKILKKLKIIV